MHCRTVGWAWLVSMLVWGAAVTPAEAARKGVDLIKTSDCVACHSFLDKDPRMAGPSYEAIAKKYRGDKKAPRLLAEKIKKGGSGTWGTIPMLPHPQFAEPDLQAMVNYILTGK